MFRNAIQKSIMESWLEFLDKDKEVMLIDGDPFLEVMVNMASANLVDMVDNHDWNRMQKMPIKKLKTKDTRIKIN